MQGNIVGGKYEILKEIGRGGMSVVYLAMDRNLNKQWAIKKVRRDNSIPDNEIVIQSFLKEANLMKRLDHPALPRIVDIIDQGDMIYVVMDYIEGEPMDRILKRLGAQPQERVIEWGKQLCDVLDYLHTRQPAIIYRDMKPANIMLRPDVTVKLIDFGTAREYKKHNTADTTSLGTRGYAAPEQFGGKGQTDARTDIYSLGVTLYHLVTGKNPSEPPYELYPIRHWNPSLSSGLEWIIQKCTQINPQDRFESCAVLLYALENEERFTEGHKVTLRRKLNGFIAAVALGIVCAGVGVTGTVMQKNVESQDYEANMDLESAEGYKKAIEIDPANKEAYLAWINLYLYRQDSEGEVKRRSYSEEEAKVLEGTFDKEHLKQLNEKDPQGYASVCYELGKLNWYFYEGTNSSGSSIEETVRTSKMIRSIRWFQMVKEQQDENGGNSYLSERDQACVDCYYKIGCFHRDKEIAEEGDSGGEKIYLNYLQNMNELVKNLEIDEPMKTNNEDDVGVTIRVQMYDLIIYSIDSYIDLFRNQGAVKEEVLELYQAAADNIGVLTTVQKRDKDTQERVAGRLDAVINKIEMGYSEGALE